MTIEALAAGLLALGGVLRRATAGLAASWDRWIVLPLERLGSRRRAIAHLSGLDARLLADIGLGRGDIELAVDGHLESDRIRHPRRRARSPAAADVAVPKAADRRLGSPCAGPLGELPQAS